MTRGDRRGPPGRPFICPCRVWRSVTGSRQAALGESTCQPSQFLLLTGSSIQADWEQIVGYRWIPIPYRRACPEEEALEEKEIGREKEGAMTMRKENRRKEEQITHSLTHSPPFPRLPFVVVVVSGLAGILFPLQQPPTPTPRKTGSTTQPSSLSFPLGSSEHVSVASHLLLGRVRPDSG
ncbi:hypothetical protein BO78DRAFT_153215 [Aspergillus sclerotiicarbonarius CBS 121057]|uniref:Uncharacterized protein n=1 Tax=Aspergillus sclerotiicarbonarius (strain CBS 121057 / IBT 28362) TaxID=1448318 RepID=A0A319E588_ASPSB|nr:hypothetical protein BO78DRAFT_153215 [Aspergillus sclerotiicarbonarius CBS 121057]